MCIIKPKEREYLVPIIVARDDIFIINKKTWHLAINVVIYANKASKHIENRNLAPIMKTVTTLAVKVRLFDRKKIVKFIKYDYSSLYGTVY